MLNSFNDILKFIKSRRYEMGWRLVLVMNNTTIHKSQSTIKWMKDKFDVVFFLPLYTPQYAQVEHFFSEFISKMLKSCWEMQTSLKSEVEKTKIKDAIWGVKQEHIINIFCHCFNQWSKQWWNFWRHIRWD